MKCINYQEKWQYTSDRGSAGGSYDYSYSYSEVENACAIIKNGIQEIGNQLKEIDKVANAISESGTTWKGEDAATYIENMKKYEVDIQELSKAYQEAINILQKTSTVEQDRETTVGIQAKSQLSVN